MVVIMVDDETEEFDDDDDDDGAIEVVGAKGSVTNRTSTQYTRHSARGMTGMSGCFQGASSDCRRKFVSHTTDRGRCISGATTIRVVSTATRGIKTRIATFPMTESRRRAFLFLHP